MDFKGIEILLEKYWQCETTEAEERELRSFFNTEGEMPEHLEVYRGLFVYQQEEQQVRLDEDFDRKVLALLPEKKTGRYYLLRYVIPVAAAVVLFLGVGELVRQRSGVAESAQTPEQALAEVRQALDFVASRLNRSGQIVEGRIGEIKSITQYIKE